MSERPLLPPLLQDLHPAASDRPRARPYNTAATSVLLCFLHPRPGDHTQIKSCSYLVNGKNSWQMHFLTVYVDLEFLWDFCCKYCRRIPVHCSFHARRFIVIFLSSCRSMAEEKSHPRPNKRIMSSLSKRSVAAHSWHDLEIGKYIFCTAV